LLCRGQDHPSERSWVRRLAGLDTGDSTDEQLARTWIAAQGPCLIFLLPGPGARRAGAVPVAGLLRRRGIPELTRLARTMTPGGPSCSPTPTPAAAYGRIGASRIIAGSIVRRLAIDAQFWVGYR
jgi:hypothetical protein